MRTMTAFITAGCAALFLSGCFGASNDPHQGGLFGYSPKAYEDRLAERQSELSYLKEQNTQAEAATSQLESQKKLKSTEVARLRRQSQAMDREAAALDKKLNDVRANSADQQAKINELRGRRAELVGGIRDVGTPDTAAKQEELNRLRGELKQLEQEAEALSRM